MADIEWTEKQKEVLSHRNSSLLVSAAAGSGKTAVLVERVIRRICDPQQPANIDAFLIVTFTSAAAAEMKAKIYSAITDRLTKDPSNRKLRRQLTLLSSAQINTVHAFCQTLIREHFEACGLSPDFRIADEFEAKTLREQVLSDLIEEEYNSNAPDFPPFVDALSAARDDRRMANVIAEIYDKLQSHPFPERWAEKTLRSLEDACTASPDNTIFGKTILSQAQMKLLPIRDTYRNILPILAQDDILSKKYLPAFEDDMRTIEQLCNLLESCSWDEICGKLSDIQFLSLKSATGYPDAEHLNACKQVRETWKGLVGTFREKYFTVNTQQAQADFTCTLPLARTLFRLVNEFEHKYSAAKRRKNMLDFSDLEHFAIALLVADIKEETVIPTKLAKELSERYVEIMVDEYQDTNEVQDAIFKAISKEETNLFMVGDIKQSIYGFRLADPFLFLNKYQTYAEEPVEHMPRKIILSQNFRSRAEVLESVNFIFKSVMTENFGDLDYTEAEYLYHGKSYPDTASDLKTELLITQTNESGESPLDLEAQSVAEKIEQMIKCGEMVLESKTGEMRPMEYGDIVILLRSPTGRAAAFSDALKQRGIPCRTDAGESLLNTVECTAALAFLQVIDNYDNDIPLVTVMRSPVYRFTTNELAIIRAHDKYKPYTTVVAEYALCGENDALKEKCHAMLTQLDAFRTRAGNMTVGRLLWHIYDTTQMLALYGAFPNGSQRQANLIAFFDLAHRFEQIGYKGLYAFIQFMNRLFENGAAGRIGAAQKANQHAVTIMSIHKSKGLEFPVVILPDCAKKANLQDLNAPVLMHAKLGVGFKAREADRHIEYPTLARRAIALRTQRETLSEELRILYVAMTRAKEKLILSAHVENYEEYADKLRLKLQFRPLSADLLLSETAVLPWVLYPQLATENAGDEGLKFWTITVTTADVIQKPQQEECRSKDAFLTEAQTQQLKKTKEYSYPYETKVNTPSKATVTGLKGRFLDEEAQSDAVSLSGKRAVKQPKKPAFLSEESLTPTQRGIAHHLVMQFMDFAKTKTPEQIRQEIKRLFAHGFLTKAQAEAVDEMRIHAFFSGALGQRMMTSESVKRELKFSILAAEKTIASILAGEKPDPEYENCSAEDKILLQGVVDCYFESDNELTLIDFKTDIFQPGTEAEILKRYRSQLDCYAYALERLTGKPVKEKYIYLFHTNTELHV